MHDFSKAACRDSQALTPGISPTKIIGKRVGEHFENTFENFEVHNSLQGALEVGYFGENIRKKMTKIVSQLTVH